MVKQKNIVLEGSVIESLGNSIFRVKLNNEHIILCHISGKIRLNSIKIIPGDKVVVEISPYDLSRGRIIKRL